MFQYGDKLEVNPDFKGIAEVVGNYPRGQGGLLEDHVEIMLNGYRMKMPMSVLNDCGLWRKVNPYTQIVEEEIVNPQQIQGVKIEPVKSESVKRYTKKK